MDDLKEVPGYGGKYLISLEGDVHRRESDGTLSEVSTSGSPQRVRFYFNGEVTRPYVYRVFQEVWPDVKTPHKLFIQKEDRDQHLT